MKNLTKIKIIMCLILLLILSGCEAYITVHGNGKDDDGMGGLINLMTETLYAEYGFSWSDGETSADFISKLGKPSTPWATTYTAGDEILYAGDSPLDPPENPILYRIPTASDLTPFIKIRGNINEIFLFSSISYARDISDTITFNLLFVDPETGHGVNVECSPEGLEDVDKCTTLDITEISAEAKKTLGDKYEIFAIVTEFEKLPDGPKVPAGLRVLCVEKK